MPQVTGGKLLQSFISLAVVALERVIFALKDVDGFDS